MFAIFSLRVSFELVLFNIALFVWLFIAIATVVAKLLTSEWNCVGRLISSNKSTHSQLVSQTWEHTWDSVWIVKTKLRALYSRTLSSSAVALVIMFLLVLAFHWDCLLLTIIWLWFNDKSWFDSFSVNWLQISKKWKSTRFIWGWWHGWAKLAFVLVKNTDLFSLFKAAFTVCLLFLEKWGRLLDSIKRWEVCLGILIIVGNSGFFNFCRQLDLNFTFFTWLLLRASAYLPTFLKAWSRGQIFNDCFNYIELTLWNLSLINLLPLDFVCV